MIASLFITNEIIFLRHTSLNINPDIFYGQTDVDVSKTFNQEVEIIKEKLLNNDINPRKIKIYTSPPNKMHKINKKII